MAPIVLMETTSAHDNFADSRFEAGLASFSDAAMLRVRVRAVASAESSRGSAEAAAPWQYVIYNS